MGRLTLETNALLRARGRDDLARDALDGVRYTDDGSTIYVHVFAKPSWPKRRPGQAYVLAFADHADLRSLAGFRELLHEAWLQLHDEIGDLTWWLEGR